MLCLYSISGSMALDWRFVLFGLGFFPVYYRYAPKTIEFIPKPSNHKKIRIPRLE